MTTVDEGITFELLGPPRCFAGGDVVHLSGTRQHRVLAMLVLQVNSTVPFDRLIDAIWEERPPKTARQQLHNAIRKLRDALAHQSAVTIVTDQVGYRLSAARDSVDLFRFRTGVRTAEAAQAAGRATDAISRLRESLDLWTGPALDGLTGRHFGDVATQLHEERFSAIERMIDLRLASGESTTLISELTVLVAQHPFRESLRASLMVALDRSGRQAEALETFENGRRLLADELGLDPSNKLKELQTAILTNNPTWPIQHAVSPSPASTATLPPSRTETVPRQLPYDIAEFTGRSGEVEEILDLAASASAATLPISVVCGMGGIGKTTLAVHVAHRVAHKYPDGQYFVDLHGFTPGVDPLDPSVVLESLLKASGLSADQIPRDPFELSRLWRSQLADRRIVLILDNVADEAQVTPLLPGTSESLVIITSRRRLPTLPGCASFILGTLNSGEAKELFCRIAGRERTADDVDGVMAVVELCGRLPLSIRITAALLRDRRTWTVGYLLQLLRSAAPRKRMFSGGVSRVIEISYSQLSADEQRFFRLQSIAPCIDFDKCSAGALAGITAEEAEAILEKLLDESLLLQSAPDRYYFHDLVRGCGQEIGGIEDDPESTKRAHQRLIDYYLQAVSTWCAHLATGPFKFVPDLATTPSVVFDVVSGEDALLKLDIENVNILEVTKLAANNGSHREAWQLVCLFHPYLRLREYGVRGTEIVKLASKSARLAGDERGVRLTQTIKGILARDDAAALSSAVKLLEEAALMSRRAGDRVAELYQMIELASTLGEDWKFALACDRLMEARNLALDMDDTFALMAISHNLGVTYRIMGRMEDALEHLLHSRRIMDPSWSITSQSALASNLGLVYDGLGRTSEAAAEFEHALRLARSAKYGYGESFALSGLGALQRHIGDFQGSLTSCRAALALGQALEIRGAECQALIHLGDTLTSIGDFAEATASYEQCRESAVKLGLKSYLCLADSGIAHIHAGQGEMSRAREHWQRALALHPPELGETANIRRHLEADSPLSTTCQRCEVADGP